MKNRQVSIAFYGAALVMVLMSAGIALAAIGIPEAVRIAQGRMPGTVTSVERESKLGRDVFEVEIRTSDAVEYEVIIDAQDGTVLEVKRDD